MTIIYEIHLYSNVPGIESFVAHRTNEPDARIVYQRIVDRVWLSLGPGTITYQVSNETKFYDGTIVKFSIREIQEEFAQQMVWEKMSIHRQKLANPKVVEHWHITCVSGAISLPACITLNEEDAYMFYANMVWAVLSVVGAKIVNEESGRTTFDDGTMIHRYSCIRQCVEPQYPRE